METKSKSVVRSVCELVDATIHLTGGYVTDIFCFCSRATANVTAVLLRAFDNNWYCARASPE